MEDRRGWVDDYFGHYGGSGSLHSSKKGEESGSQDQWALLLDADGGGGGGAWSVESVALSDSSVSYR